MIETTLKRYHCSKLSPYKILNILSPRELDAFQSKQAIDLGLYPMPHHMLDEPIIFYSQNDEATNGRMFQEGTYELVENGDMTQKVFD